MPEFMKSAMVFVLAMGLGGAVQAQEPSADTVVATVGSDTITLGHMIVMASQLPQEYQSLPDDVLYSAILEQLVRQAAVAQSGDGVLSKSDNLTIENQKRSLLAGAALDKALSESVTEDAVKAAYDEQYGNAEPVTEYNAAHILLASEDDAKAVKAELDAGADFATLAKEKSTGPSGPSGGELGWFSKGMMVPEFEAAVVALTPGQISDPIQTQFGWHVIKLAETREQPKPTLDEMREEIRSGLEQAAAESAIAELTGKVEVVRPETEIDPAQLRNIELLKR